MSDKEWAFDIGAETPAAQYWKTLYSNVTAQQSVMGIALKMIGDITKDEKTREYVQQALESLPTDAKALLQRLEALEKVVAAAEEVKPGELSLVFPINTINRMNLEALRKALNELDALAGAQEAQG